MKKLITGVLITLLGAFLLLNHFDFFEDWVPKVILSWPSLLAAIGFVFLFDRKDGHNTVGFVLLVIAAFFLIPRIWDLNMRGITLPVLIIAAGIALTLKAVRRKKFTENSEYCQGGWKGKNFQNSSFDNTTITGGVVKREYVFNGSKEKWTYGKLRNVVIEAVFSGVELDFTQTELADDIKVAAHIKVSAVFSGITLYVPDDWNIMVQKTGVFGGFVDNRPRSCEQNVNKDKLVILELEAVFGGGEIKCYE
ncbi:hypothetical protein FACS189413_14250 [Bacteroidia bacterium]|nr:hypothetical protein FACS189413_14250 [Bacteroidia bacterium]